MTLCSWENREHSIPSAWSTWWSRSTSAIEDEFKVSLTLADEKAMSYSRSPFRTVQTLRDYVNDLLKNDVHA